MQFNLYKMYWKNYINLLEINVIVKVSSLELKNFKFHEWEMEVIFTI